MIAHFIFSIPATGQTPSLVAQFSDSSREKSNTPFNGNLSSAPFVHPNALASLRLWLWEQESLSPTNTEDTSSLRQLPVLFPRITDFSQISSNAFSTNVLDFKESSAYRIQRAIKLQDELQGRPSNVLRHTFSIPLGGNLGMTVCPDNDIRERLKNGQLALTEKELEMLLFLWIYPEISGTDWYTLYAQTHPEEPISYTLFLYRINILHNKQVLCTRRTHYKGRFYRVAFSLRDLLLDVKKALDSSDALSFPQQHKRLLSMRRKLEDLLYGDLFFTRFQKKRDRFPYPYLQRNK